MINLKIKDKITLKELQDLAEMMVIFKELTNHGVIFWSKKRQNTYYRGAYCNAKNVRRARKFFKVS